MLQKRMIRLSALLAAAALLTGCGDAGSAENSVSSGAADSAALSADAETESSTAETAGEQTDSAAETAGTAEASAESGDAAETTEQPEETDPAADVENLSVQAEGYRVISMQIGGNVYCAQIEGLADAAVQQRINESLESIERSRYDQYIVPYYTAYPVVHYADAEVLSLTQTAVFGEDGAGYSLTQQNYNMRTGEKLELTEIADLDVLAEKIYANDGVTVTGDYAGAKLTDYTESEYVSSVEDVREDLERCHFTLDSERNVVISLMTDRGFIKVTVKQ